MPLIFALSDVIRLTLAQLTLAQFYVLNDNECRLVNDFFLFF